MLPDGSDPTAPATAPPDPDAWDRTFLPFPEPQVDLLVRLLLRDVLRRHPDIDAADVVGHADVAPERRVDPGPLFPWRRLAQGGIGVRYDEAAVAQRITSLERDPPELAFVQRALAAWGHAIEARGREDARSRYALRAFQLHFRPGRHDGRVDAETTAVLPDLLERHRPDAWRRLVDGWPAVVGVVDPVTNGP